MIKKCVVCAAEFGAHHRPHFNCRTCSDTCAEENKRQNRRRASQAYRNRNVTEKRAQCKSCGSEFSATTSRRAYCSDDCKRLSIKNVNRQQYLKNRNARIEACREWRKNNRQRVSDAVKRYKLENPDRVAKWMENSRDRRLAADRERNSRRTAALQLIRELQSKGLEALL